MAALVRHTGAGVARRDAYHERRSVERAELEEVDVDNLLAVEQRGDVIVKVEAGTIVVEADGPNYTPHVKHERKKARRARQQEAARQKQAGAAEAEAVAEAEAEAEAEASGEESAEPVARGATTAVRPPACGEQRVNGRLTNALCDAFGDEEVSCRAGRRGHVVWRVVVW